MKTSPRINLRFQEGRFSDNQLAGASIRDSCRVRQSAFQGVVVSTTALSGIVIRASSNGAPNVQLRIEQVA